MPASAPTALRLLALCLFMLCMAGRPSIAAEPRPGPLPTVTIGVVADHEPYSWVENGRVVGFSIDVLDEIARQAGLRFEYRAGSWPELYPAFLRGEIDAIDGISYREERSSQVRFTAPYHLRHTVVMHDTRRPLPPITDLAGLKPFRVGIVRDIYFKSALVDHGIELVEYDGLPNLVRAIAFGWVDAIVGPELALGFLARKAGFNHIGVAARIPMGGLEIEDFRIGVPPRAADLHARLAAAVAAIVPGRLAELEHRWQELGGRPAETGGDFRLSEQQALYVRGLGPLRVGITRDYPPFSFADDGRTQGLAVDVLLRVQDLTGLQTITVVDTWPVLLELFQRGEIDLIANISETPERRRFTRFTAPYHRIPNVVFTRTEHTRRLTSAGQLHGMRVAVTAGVFYEQALRAHLGDSVLGFSSQQAMFTALAEGSVDAVLSPLHNGQHWIRTLGLSSLHVAGELELEGHAGEDLRFGVRPALEPLAAIIDAALASLSPTEHRTIANRWLGAALPAAAGGGDGTPVAFDDRERSFLQERQNTLKVCTSPNWMPFEGVDARGHHSGMAADFLGLFASRSGVHFETVHLPSWNDALEAIRERRCDLLTLAVQTPERLAYLNFTDPYYTVPHILLGRIETPFLDDMDQLAGRNVGVVRGHSLLRWLRERYPLIHIVEVDSEIDGLHRLQRGTLYGLLSNLNSAGYHLHELGLADIKVLGRIPGDATLSVATRNDLPELHAIARKLIATLGTQDRHRIESKWRAIAVEQKVDYRLLWQWASVGVLALVALLLWNRKLGTLNRQLAEANARLEQYSLSDGLTGLGNRKYFDREFDAGFAWCQRSRTGFAVVMIDIDHFKHINDTWGHPAGDECLRLLADCLRTHFRRDTDRLARLGGEEFVLFLPFSDADATLARIEAVHAEIATLRVPAGSQGIGFTISAGVAIGIPSAAEYAADYLKRADQALYEAKRSGRDRIIVDRR